MAKKFNSRLFLTRMVAFVLFFLPFCLNQGWQADGGNWRYFFSRYLFGSELVIVGLLMALFPRQFHVWVKENLQ